MIFMIFLERPSFGHSEPLCFPESEGDWMTAYEMEDRFFSPSLLHIKNTKEPGNDNG